MRLTTSRCWPKILLPDLVQGLADHHLAQRHSAKATFPLCCGASPADESGLLAKRTIAGAMAVGRMASGGNATTKYWLGSLAPDTDLTALVTTAKQRWIIERDYEEPKKKLGLGYYEGRSWRGFHHHATPCIAAYGFLIAERSRCSAPPALDSSNLSYPKLPPGWKPGGASATS